MSTHQRCRKGAAVRITLRDGRVVCGRFIEEKSGRCRLDGVGWLSTREIRTFTLDRRRAGVC